ncbi:MAG: type IV secretion system DNA-binding domain-containing protein, partial [Novosphingobium sp.]|nr:type IV secretion system DNA-binding domain-containing protein [Novosphingobium sp.]
MIQGHDFKSRSHSLWRMRMAHLRQRFRFFWQLVLGCTLFGSALAAQFFMPPRGTLLAFQCLGARGLVLLGEMAGRELRMNVTIGVYKTQLYARTVAYSEYWLRPYDLLLDCLFWGAWAGLALGLLVIWLIQRNMSSQGEQTLGDRVLGGTRVIGETQLAAHTAPRADPASLAIGPVPVPRGIETRHFAFLGTTGSGKTTALRQMLDRIEARGEPALVYDTSGEFIAHYYNPERGDVILNPFDARCAFWSPFDEISHPADADRIARQLVSETGSQDDDVWLETSRILVANMLRSLWAEKNCNLEALLEALQVKSKEQLKHWLGHTS